jgi:hypothetical protein
MSRTPRLLLLALVLGTLGSVVGIGLTVLFNWFFRGELGLTGDAVARLVILAFLIGAMPVGLAFAHSRKEKA